MGYLLFFFSKHNFFILFFFRKSIRDSTKEIVQKMKFKVKFAIALIDFAMILKNSQECCHTTVGRCLGMKRRYDDTSLENRYNKSAKKKQHDNNGNEIVEADVSGEYTAQTKRAAKNENPMENIANVIEMLKSYLAF